jgi:hypothetical protein
MVKPKHIYTFMCGQDFRRDEVCSHFKDFHADVQGGLAGWIERRCPLAYLGCSFKVRRVEPVDSDGDKTLVYSRCEVKLRMNGNFMMLLLALSMTSAWPYGSVALFYLWKYE